MQHDRLALESVLARCDGGEDGFECVSESGQYRLQLWGMLPRAWAGNLALHCFASGLDITAADALRLAGNRWAASFLLRPAGGTNGTDGAGATGPARGRPVGDFLRMARRAPRLVPTLPEPEVHVAMASSRERPGCVFAHVTGQDSIGLLAELLRRFEAFGLCPRQLCLRSDEDGIRDWFWLEPDPDLARHADVLGAVEELAGVR
jgi:hypothetical protein